MPILHGFICAAHGEYEAFVETGATDGTVAPCPFGCSHDMVRKVLGCAISTGRSKEVAGFVDRKMKSIAEQFGVGDLDIRNGRSSEPSDYNFNETRDEHKMRLAGQTYAIPNDPQECEVVNGEFVHKKDDSAAIGRAGVAGDSNLTQAMKGFFNEALKKNTHIVASDNSQLPTP